MDIGDILNPSAGGGLSKMVLTAYSDPDCTTTVDGVDPYTVMFNPSNISEKYAIEYATDDKPGSTSEELKYTRTKPQDFAFEFTLDGTGVASTQVKGSIINEVDTLLSVVYNYNSDEHRPNFVKIVYGAFVFKGGLIGIDISYTLLDNQGQPIRAKVNLSFRNSASVEMGQRIQHGNSPDVTHKRIFQASQTLASMAYTIYERNDLYGEVARANNFNNFRRIQQGTAVYFPALSSSSSSTSGAASSSSSSTQTSN